MEMLQELYIHVLTREFWETVARFWFVAGFFASVIYYVFANGGASPWGDKLGRQQFWILVIFGWLSVVVAVYSCIYVRVKRK